MSTALIVLNALLTTCRAYGGGTVFTEANSALNNWRMLDAQDTELSLVIESGTIEEADALPGHGSYGEYVEMHKPRINVAVKVGTGAQGYPALISTLQTTVEGLKDYLRIHNRLDNTPVIARARTAKTSDVLDVLRKGQGSPSHFMQRIDMQIITEAELPAGDEGGW